MVFKGSVEPAKRGNLSRHQKSNLGPHLLMGALLKIYFLLRSQKCVTGTGFEMPENVYKKLLHYFFVHNKIYMRNEFFLEDISDGEV